MDGATPDGHTWSLPLRLSLQLRARELDFELDDVSLAELTAAVINRAGEASQALCLWLRLVPTPEDVATVWETKPPASAELDVTFDDWARKLSELERSQLWLEFVDRGVQERWRARLRTAGTNDAMLVRELVDRVNSEATATGRAAVAENLVALKPQGEVGKAVINLAIELFGKNMKKDVETAARLVLASSRHRVGELRALFAGADAAGRAPDGRLRKHLEAEGWLRKPKPEKKHRFGLRW